MVTRSELDLQDIRAEFKKLYKSSLHSAIKVRKWWWRTLSRCSGTNHSWKDGACWMFLWHLDNVKLRFGFWAFQTVLSTHSSGVASAGGAENSFLLVCVAVSSSLTWGVITGTAWWPSAEEMTDLIRTEKKPCFSSCRPVGLPSFPLFSLFHKNNQQPFYCLQTSVRKKNVTKQLTLF